MNIIRTIGCFAMMLFVGPLLSQETDSLKVMKEYKKAREFIVARKYDQGAQILDSLAKNVDKESLKETYFNIKLTKVLIYQNTRQFEIGEAYRTAVLQEMEGQLERPHQLFGWAIMLKAELLYDQNRLLESIPIYKEALAEYATLTSAKAYQKKGAIYSVLGINYARRSYYDIAAEYFSKADNIFSNYLKDPEEIWRIKTNIGNLYYLQTQYSKAAKYYQESLDLKRTHLGDFHPSLIKGYNNLASLYSEMGKLELAREYEEYAYRISENYSEESEAEKIFRFISMALMLESFERDEEAISELNKAEAVIKGRSAEYPELKADLNYQWGTLYLNNGEPKKAIAFFKKVINQYAKVTGKTNQIVPKAMSSIANAYTDLNQKVKALEMYDKAVSAYKSLYGEQYSNLTKQYIDITKRIYTPNSQFDKSIELLNMAEGSIPGYNRSDTTNFSNVQDKNLLLLSFSEKALVYYRQFEETEEFKYAHLSLYYRKLCDLLVVDLQENGSYDDHLNMLNNLNEVYDKSLILEDKLFRATKNHDYLKEGFYLAERSRNALLRQQLLETEQKKFGQLPPELLKLEEKLKNDISYSKSQLYNLSNASNNGLTDSSKFTFYQDRLFLKQRSLDSLKTVFERDYQDYFNARYEVGEISIAKIQAALDEQTQLIQFISTSQGVLIFSITSSDAKLLKVDNAESDRLRVQAHLELLANPNSDIDKVKKSGKALYDQLFRPIEPLKEHLNIIADGELSRLPFETLSIKDASNQDRYLLEAYRIQYLNAASDLSEVSITKPLSKIDLLAMATTYSPGVETQVADTMRAGLGPLKFTVEEAQNLLDTYGGMALLNNEATEANFRKYAKDKGIIHIASHGIVDNNQPLFSRLILEKDPKDSIHDGNLFVHELYNMSLDANLVVLSACNTASGEVADGEGLLNIGRGFFYAGVPSVVMSHWQVDDQSTGELMKYFYEALADGSSKSEALRQAKLKFMAEASPNKKHPFYWAAFISMGDDSPVVKSGFGPAVYITGALALLLIFLAQGLRRRAKKIS